MKKSKIRDRLLTCARNREYVRFYRSEIETNYCVWLGAGYSDRLFMGWWEDDFQFDGLGIVRPKDVTWAGWRKDDGFYTRLLREEGVAEGMDFPQYDIDSWRSLFDDLRRKDEFCIVELEKISSDDRHYSWFNIGKVLKAAEDELLIWTFGPDGKWRDIPSRIPYKKITLVRLKTRYINTFAKYVDEFKL